MCGAVVDFRTFDPYFPPTIFKMICTKCYRHHIHLDGKILYFIWQIFVLNIHIHNSLGTYQPKRLVQYNTLYQMVQEYSEGLTFNKKYLLNRENFHSSSLGQSQ